MLNSIICGDCLEVMKQMPDKSIDLVLTDPPYKLSQEYSSNADPDNLIAVASLYESSKEMYRLAKDGSICILFYDTRILPLALHAMNKSGWKYLRALTLYRRAGNAHKLSGWMSTSDFILIFVKGTAKPVFYGPWKHDVYIKDKMEKIGYNHPAQKPVNILEHLILNTTKEKGIVLDPYLGCGSTAEASLRVKRNYIGIEISPEYCAIAEARIKSISNPLF